MAKYKEIKVDLKVTTEMILEQFLVQRRQKVEPTGHDMHLKSSGTKSPK